MIDKLTGSADFKNACEKINELVDYCNGVSNLNSGHVCECGCAAAHSQDKHNWTCDNCGRVRYVP